MRAVYTAQCCLPEPPVGLWSSERSNRQARTSASAIQRAYPSLRVPLRAPRRHGNQGGADPQPRPAPPLARPRSTWRLPTRKWRGRGAPGARSRGTLARPRPVPPPGLSLPPASRIPLAPVQDGRFLPARPGLLHSRGRSRGEAKPRGRREPGPAAADGSYQPGRRRSRAARGGGRAVGAQALGRRRREARGCVRRPGRRGGDVGPCASTEERDPRSGGGLPAGPPDISP